VEIEVHGEDFANPFVYMATFTATWRLREEVQVTVPAVIGLKRRDAALKIEAAGLTPWHSGPGRTVDSTDPPAGRKVTRRSRVKLVCPPSVGTDGGGQGNPP
jgi:beta-lactam-binding protein with PASTA domain